MSAIIFGLMAAATFGAGDFCGGFATKRNNVYSVIIVSQLVGGALLVGAALILAGGVASTGTLVFGALAGLAGAIGLLALYSSLARGRMGVVAPLTAVVAVVFPVIIGMFNEGLPSTTQLAGLGLAPFAVWFLSRDGRSGTVHAREGGLAICAGLAFGLFFIFIDRVSESAILWPLVAAKGASLVMLTLIVLVRKRCDVPARDQLPVIALAGVFDTGGNVLFALASRFGRLDIATVLSSLYPATTVLLAWMILKERLAPRQWVGVACAFLAIVCIVCN